MKTLYIFGNKDCLATPTRLSISQNHQPEEKLWAKLHTDKIDDFLRLASSRLGTDISLEKTFREPVQHIVEAAKWLFDDGELAEYEFQLEMYDWYIENTITTFARSFKPN